MNRINITIGIPTFNRTHVLISNLNALITIPDIRIYVSSNCVDKDLESFCKQNNIEYTCNETNLGLQGNLINLLKNIQTDYILFLSDEDTLSANIYSNFISYINRREFDYGVVGIQSNQKIISKPNAKLVNLDEVHSSSILYSEPEYLSGLIINKNSLNFKLEFLETDSLFKKSLYPHVYIKQNLVKSRVLIYDQPLVIKGDDCISGGDKAVNHDGYKKSIYGVQARLDEYNRLIISAKLNKKYNLYIHIDAVIRLIDRTTIASKIFKESIANSNILPLYLRSFLLRNIIRQILLCVRLAFKIYFYIKK